MFLFVFVFLMSFAYAAELNFKELECESILIYKDKVIGQQIPSEVPFSTEIFNIYIAEEIYGYIELNDSYVEDFGCGKNEDATYDILIESEQTLFDIYESDDMMNMILDKINDKEINIKGKKFSKKIKSGFIKLGLKIWNWFR